MSGADNLAVIRLPVPLMAIDREVSELAMRAPTGEDFGEAGYPVRFLPSGATEFDARAMTRMIGRLAGIPLATANKLPAPQWNEAAMAILGFLNPGAASA